MFILSWLAAGTPQKKHSPRTGRLSKAFLQTNTDTNVVPAGPPPGLDEMRQTPLDVQQDYVAWMQSPRCHGYLSRLEEHQRLLGAA